MRIDISIGRMERPWPYSSWFVESSLYWVVRSLNLGNDKPLKPEILHTATQNKSFQAITVNIKDFSMARYLSCSKKCYRRFRKWLNSETQEVYLKLNLFFVLIIHQIGIKEPHTKFQVINFTWDMTILIFLKFASTPHACPKICDKNTVIPLQPLMLEVVQYI